MLNKKTLLKNVKNSWKKILDDNKLDSILIEINNKIKNSKTILPLEKNIFRAFEYFDLNETKVVFLGQDPYYNLRKCNTPVATGLSFSVDYNYKIPPSLMNIFKELKLEYKNYKIPNHGNLERWSKEENILLLNTSLTVEVNKPNSHSKLWENYTNKIIQYISDNVKNVVFILLGNNAQKKIKFINIKNKLNYNLEIISAPHPSPLSAYKGFFNSNIFKKTNDYFNLINSYKKLYFCFINKNYTFINYNILQNIFFFFNYKIINWNI